SLFFSLSRHPPGPTRIPYTTLFRSHAVTEHVGTAPDEAERAQATAEKRLQLAQVCVDGLRALHVQNDRERSCVPGGPDLFDACRSEEHTSELQSRRDLVCRLLLEKK